MTQEQRTAVDTYITDLLIRPDPVLNAALQAAEEAGLPAIQAAPNQGNLLSMAIQTAGSKGYDGFAPVSVTGD